MAVGVVDLLCLCPPLSTLSPMMLDFCEISSSSRMRPPWSTFFAVLTLSAPINNVPSSSQLIFADWGNHTGTIDWCETNYTHTPYIAEFINTLTNVPVILLGLYGAVISTLNGINRRYILCYLGLSLIGIGSIGYHCTLTWNWQLMDEMPMVRVVTRAKTEEARLMP